ncbi:MAG: hypothetical protein KC457_15365 [Myxococcales bacterium]|nr:hypothetical protein [Myxococcales bacterium]
MSCTGDPAHFRQAPAGVGSRPSPRRPEVTMSRTIFSTQPRSSAAPKLPPRLEGGLPLLGHALEFNANPV